mmetsp:Transcript_65465/g.188637  ORF Transcript_65465/g.188637 Transcript_65465/m.188637 type:complete len:231 (+) Transcript_65465:1232-1924(+)
MSYPRSRFARQHWRRFRYPQRGCCCQNQLAWRRSVGSCRFATVRRCSPKVATRASTGPTAPEARRATESLGRPQGLRRRHATRHWPRRLRMKGLPMLPAAARELPRHNRQRLAPRLQSSRAASTRWSDPAPLAAPETVKVGTPRVGRLASSKEAAPPKQPPPGSQRAAGSLPTRHAWARRPPTLAPRRRLPQPLQCGRQRPAPAPQCSPQTMAAASPARLKVSSAACAAA